jgi:hypothetical protein
MMSDIPEAFMLLVEQMAHACDNAYRRGFYHGDRCSQEGEESSIKTWMQRLHEQQVIATPPPVPRYKDYPNKNCVQLLDDFKMEEWTQLNILLKQYREEIPLEPPTTPS